MEAQFPFKEALALKGALVPFGEAFKEAFRLEGTLQGALVSFGGAIVSLQGAFYR